MTGKEFEAIQKNAEWGDANAQCILGICYYNGEGVEKTKAKRPTGSKKRQSRGMQLPGRYSRCSRRSREKACSGFSDADKECCLQRRRSASPLRGKRSYASNLRAG